MADAVAEKAQWVLRVLGVDVSGAVSAAGPDPMARWRDSLLAWRAADGAVEMQLGALRSALLATGHDQLREIAMSRLSEVIGGNTEALRSVVAHIGDGAAGKLEKGRAKALSTVRAFRTHLAGDVRVEACDENELGVAVSLRSTLDPALAAMEAALRS